MLGLIVYFFGLGLCFVLIIFAWSMIVFSFFGPPAVPTPSKIIKEVLKEISPQKDDFFIDLGSGTGRVVKTVVREYGVKGLGVEINPLFVWWARLTAKLGGLKNIEFKRENFFKTDFAKADIVFMYLLPKYLSKMAEKIEKEGKTGTIVVSQRFWIDGWEKYLIKEIKRKHNSTYTYQI